MPWKESRIVDERMKFVVLYREGEHSMTELCERFGVSRKTGYKWWQRYQNEGLRGLENQSRAFLHHPKTISESIWELVLEAKKQHTRWGPKKICHIVKKAYPNLPIPARSTIAKRFRADGLSKKRGRRRSVQPFSQPFLSTRYPNATWCADYKGWFKTTDKKRCEPLTITDAYSRYSLCCEAVSTTKYTYARPAFEKTFIEYGLPDAIRTDNGSPFVTRGIVALSRLAIWWLKLGILPERIAPSHPEQNGRHERFHLTLKEETAQPPEANMEQQQVAFDLFREEYNNTRPHESLGMKTPSEVYKPSARQYPYYIKPVEYGEGFLTRKVRINGEIKWKGSTIFLSTLLRGEPVGLKQTCDRYWRIYFGRLQLAWLDDYKNKLLPLTSKKPGIKKAYENGPGIAPHEEQYLIDDKV